MPGRFDESKHPRDKGKFATKAGEAARTLAPVAATSVAATTAFTVATKYGKFDLNAFEAKHGSFAGPMLSGPPTHPKNWPVASHEHGPLPVEGHPLIGHADFGAGEKINHNGPGKLSPDLKEGVRKFTGATGGMKHLRENLTAPDSRSLHAAVGGAPANAPYIYRGIKLGGEDFAKLSEGDHMNLPLSSFSDSPHTAENFSHHILGKGPGAKNVILHVPPGSAALHVAKHSQFKHEREWIGGGSYQIHKIEHGADGLAHLHLKQVARLVPAVVKIVKRDDRRDVLHGTSVAGNTVASTVGLQFGAAKLRDAYKEEHPDKFRKLTMRGGQKLVHHGVAPAKAAHAVRIARTGKPHFKALVAASTAASVAEGSRRLNEHLERKHRHTAVVKFVPPTRSQRKDLHERLRQAKNPPPPKLQRVDSSALHSVGYQRQTRRMDVTFNGRPDKRYSYRMKPKKAEELLGADSKGRHYAKKVKGKYPDGTKTHLSDRARLLVSPVQKSAFGVQL